MDTAGAREFAVTVNVPRSYIGAANLRVSLDSVTLIARPIRHYRAIVLSCVGAILVVMVGGLAMPGSLEIRAVLIGVIVGVLVGVLSSLLRSSGGDPRTMSLPREGVSLAKHNGRVLVVSAAFDAGVRSGRWTFVAASPEDAQALASALGAASD